MTQKHIPVLLDELVSGIKIDKDKKNIIVDSTLGLGGHAEKIIERMNCGDIFIGFDADVKNFTQAKKRLEKINLCVEKFFINTNFVNIKKELEKIKIKEISGVYFDLGISSLHIDEAERGFSFRLDGPLDMRFDKTYGKTASDILNSYKEKELINLFKLYGEDPLSAKITKEIVKIRKTDSKFTKTKDLADLIDKITKNPKTKARIFQALRIETNNEIENLKVALKDSINLLQKGGNIFVISFHSLEDRIVKNTFRDESKDCICKDLICTCNHKKSLKIITKKPIIPKNDEIKNNSRSRSAKARNATKI